MIMKVKDLLYDYIKIPNHKIKHIGDNIKRLYDNLKISLKDNILEPTLLINVYNPYFKNYDNLFKSEILNNENSKTGMFVTLRNNYTIDLAIKDLFDFTVTKHNFLLNYLIDKLQKLVEVEVSLLLDTYDYIYDFLIKYAIIRLLFNRFKFYTQSAIDNRFIINILLDSDDFDIIYSNILELDVDNLYHINNERICKLKSPKLTENKSTINKPKCIEDLTMYFLDSEETLTQLQKFEIISKAYNVSIPTAKRWMKNFNLLKKSTKAILLEKLHEEHEEIKTIIFNENASVIDYIDKSKEEIIKEVVKCEREKCCLRDLILDLTDKVDTLLKTVDEQNKKIDMLLQKVDQQTVIINSQKTEIESLLNKLFWKTIDINDLKI